MTQIPPNQPPYGYGAPPPQPPPGQYPPGQYPPQALGYAPPPPAGGPLDVGEVARRQRAVMWCLLAYIGLVVVNVALNVSAQPAAGPNPLAMAVGLVILAVGITSAVFVFRLAMTAYGQGTGVVMGILTLIPCVGLIVLLIVNGKATALLRQHGIKVGLMGADPSQIPSAGNSPGGSYPPPPSPPGGYPPRP